MPYTPEQLREIYLKLPQDLRDALFDVDISELIIAIGKKHHLAVDEMGKLASETGRVMLGVTHPNQFISNLVQRLEVDKAKAKEIAEDINVNVFKKIRESLKKIHNIRDTEEKTEDLPKVKPSGAGEIEPREEILKEIEKEEEIPKPPMPDILKGSTSPIEENPPPAETKQKYQSGMDPYREPVS